jgi:GNAT superfamily N-acetyltransferase
MNDELRIEDDGSPEDVARLNDLLHEFGAAATGVHDGRWLTILVKDAAGDITAGLHGWTWGGALGVMTLWVRDDLRRQGLGTRLLAAAEAEAVRRGCSVAFLDTHDFQAPAFYRARGWEVLGELPGWPGNTTRVFFRKRLRQET